MLVTVILSATLEILSKYISYRLVHTKCSWNCSLRGGLQKMFKTIIFLIMDAANDPEMKKCQWWKPWAQVCKINIHIIPRSNCTKTFLKYIHAILPLAQHEGSILILFWLYFKVHSLKTKSFSAKKFQGKWNL